MLRSEGTPKTRGKSLIMCHTNSIELFTWVLTSECLLAKSSEPKGSVGFSLPFLLGTESYNNRTLCTVTTWLCKKVLACCGNYDILTAKLFSLP
jgi:hypothetical protein